MKKLLATLLAIIMAFSIALIGCAPKDDPVAPDDPPSSGVEEGSGAGEGESEGEGEESDDNAPLKSSYYGKQNKSDLVFNYTAEKLDAVLAVYENIKTICEEETMTEEEVEAVLDDMDEKESELVDQRLLSEINYYSNTKDKDNHKAFLKMEEMYNKLWNTRRTVYEPAYKSKYKTAFYGDMTDEEIEDFIANNLPSDEAETLSNEINELTTDYGQLNFAAKKKQFGTFYSKFVEKQTQLSNINGYDNFIEDCYENTYHRDFTANEVKDFAALLGDKFVPMVKSSNDYIKKASYEELKAVDNVRNAVGVNFSDDKAKAILDEFYEFVGGEIYDAYKHIMEDGYLYYADEKNSYGVAFTSYFYGAQEPIIFLSRESSSMLTFVHEFGHYCNYYLREDAEEVSFELAETHSQGAEWLFLSWYEAHSEVGKEAGQGYAKYQFFMDGYSVYLSTMIGLFENEVYTKAAAGQIGTTTAEYDSIMKDVIADSHCAELGDIYANSGFSFYNEYQYYKLVVIDSPGYYISYAVSLISAYTLYAYAQTDLRAAIDTYTLLLKKSQGYLKVLEDLDIDTPFEGGTFDIISAAIFG